MARKRLRTVAGAAEEHLKSGTRKVRAQLADVERAAGKLASKVKARRRMRMSGDASGAPVSAPTAGSAGTPVSPGPIVSPVADPVPDDSWTVADLRAEARRRGMTGYSRKTKAQLVADLRG